MLEQAHRTIAPKLAPTLALVVAAAAFQTAAAVPQIQDGSQDGPKITPTAQDEAGQRALHQLQTLMQDGHYVKARIAAVELVENSQNLTKEQIDRALGFVVTADERIQRMDRIDVSIEHARASFEAGDLATALRHAEATSGHPSATSEQLQEARDVLSQIQDQRTELAPLITNAVAQVKADMDNRRYAEAKAGLDAIHRSSVELTNAQRTVVEMFRDQIVSLEEAQGAAFDAPRVSLGMIQPDVVTRRGEQGGEAGGEQTPALEDLPGQPEADPQPAQPPAAQPEQVDLIQVAMRAEAMGILGEANRAFGDLDWVGAQTRYRQLQDEYLAFLSDEQRSEVANQLQRIAIELQQPDDPIQGEIDRAAAVRSQTQAEFESLMGRADRAMRSGALGDARAAQAEARLIINSRRAYFNENQFNDYDRQVEALRAQIETEERNLRERKADAQTDIFERQARDAEQRAAEKRKSTIDELIDRARSYQAEGRYEEALQTVDRLLFQDPRNPSGLLLRDVYRDIIIFSRHRAAVHESRYSFAEIQLENAEARLPRPGIVNYPKDWRSISIRRGAPDAYQDTPQNAAIYADLRSQRIPSIELVDNSLEDVVRYVESYTGQNVDADWNELGNVAIQPESTVSMTLKGVTVSTLLDRVMDKVSPDDLSRAGWEVRDGIIIISSEQAIRKNTHFHIYDIKDLLLDVPDYDEVPQIDLQQAMQQSQGGRGGGGGSAQSPFNNDDQQDQNEDRRTLEERTLDIIDIITSNVDFDGWIDNGGETGKIQNWNGNLIVTNTVGNHAQIHGLLQKLRAVRAMQINVETRFLLVNQDYFEQIGFDLDVYWNANNNQFRVANANDATVRPSDFFSDNGLNRSVTGAGNAVDLNNDGDTADPGETPTNDPQGVINPRPWSIIGNQQNSLGLAESLMPAAGIASSVLGAAPAIGLVGSFVDDIQVDFLVKATQADRRSVALTAPRLTFMNGQIANIYVATQQAYISDLEPVVADSAVGFDPTVAVATEGVTMLVEGVISSDRRYVTMNVDVGISRIDGFATQPVTAVAGGQLINSADTASFIQLPQVTVTRVRTSVTVPDQGTVLLGGQRLTTEFEVESGVPVLSKIPILNRFFSNRVQSRDEQTLLILIRPTVLIQNELEEEAEPGLNNIMSSGLGLGG